MTTRRLVTLHRGPTVLLAIVNVALVWACVARVWHGSAAQKILATPPQRIAPPAPLREPTRSVVDPTGIQSAALFYESRSFYTPPLIPEVQPRPDYRLSSTWMLPKHPATALLVQNQTGARIKVQPGREIEGWTVESIDAQRVVLRHGEQHLEIRSAHQARQSGMAPVSSVPINARPAGTGVRLLGQPFAPSSARP